MIELKNVSRTFGKNTGAEVRAVKNASFTVEDDEIFGVIGYSGAGKSTLVRCINLLERPDSGEVWVDGRNLMDLDQRELRRARRNIGMIFQLFNLFPSRTVAENIAFPLNYTGMSKEAVEKRVDEMLELVGIRDKKKAYPSQLSGGQKQRVGIARALASKPRILLCDEATSALDPQTTQSILSLLKDLNSRLGFTIVIITHEMQVVKSICTSAVVMDSGEIVERGSVFNLFSNPQLPITRDFIATTSTLGKVYDLLRGNSPAVSLSPGQILAKFSYVGKNAVKALISTASIRFGLRINIILADLDIIQDTPIGALVNIIEGEPEAVGSAFAWFRGQGVKIEEIAHG
jgi:D-methionine transport system ATP-binding protein